MNSGKEQVGRPEEVFVAAVFEHGAVISDAGQDFLVRFKPFRQKVNQAELTEVVKVGIATANCDWPRNDTVRVDVLFVALGMVKQERWIYNNREKLKDSGVRLAMGVGGAFDYISGAVPRAPKFMRDAGLEWLFRLLVQPWRLKRQLALLEFVTMVMRGRKEE